MGILGLALVLVVASWFLVPLLWARGLLAAGRRWAGLEQATVEVDDCRWRYLQGGSGPVLVVLHGFGADGDNWLRVAPALTRHFRVIAPDLPGFGQSVSTGTLEFDIDSQVKRLHAFLKAIGVTPYIMAGNSMGGWITAAYADRYPGQLRALWLLAPLGLHDARQTSMLESIALNRDSPLQVENLAQFRERVLEPMFGQLPWLPYPLLVHYAIKARKFSKAAPAMFRQVSSKSEALESLAGRIEIPVLLQWGAKDRAVDVFGVDVLRKTVPEITVRVQDQAGHLPMLETPAASAKFFTDFCTRHGLI